MWISANIWIFVTVFWKNQNVCLWQLIKFLGSPYITIGDIYWWHNNDKHWLKLVQTLLLHTYTMKDCLSIFYFTIMDWATANDGSHHRWVQRWDVSPILEPHIRPHWSQANCPSGRSVSRALCCRRFFRGWRCELPQTAWLHHGKPGATQVCPAP